MSWQDTFKRRWKLACSTAIAVVSVYIWTIFSVQPNVPVTGGPILTPVSNTQYALVQEYTTSFTVGRTNYVIVVASNTVTDGASIPIKLVSAFGITPWSGVIIRGALVHDLLYQAELLPRDLCDLALYVICRKDGMIEAKAAGVYRAVSDVGGEVWEKHTPASIAAARLRVTLIATPIGS